MSASGAPNTKYVEFANAIQRDDDGTRSNVGLGSFFKTQPARLLAHCGVRPKPDKSPAATPPSERSRNLSLPVIAGTVCRVEAVTLFIIDLPARRGQEVSHDESGDGRGKPARDGVAIINRPLFSSCENFSITKQNDAQ